MLKDIDPKLLDEEYIYYSVPNAKYGDCSELNPIFSFHEDEGLTLVILKSEADKHNIMYDDVFCCISLGLHSSLLSVGLTAAISSKLAESGICANMAAGYFHDHIFIPLNKAQKAMKLLSEI